MMPSRSLPRRSRSRAPARSVRSWTIRGALAAAVAIVGGFATTFSIAWTQVSRDPSLAHQLAPYDGRITGVYAASLTGPEAPAVKRSQADVLASHALRQDATSVTAASTLGLDAQMDGKAGAARRYFDYAQSLSRRDLQTQLWAIEDAVAHGDIRSTLNHYDIALRTTARGGDLFFPILAAASQDAQVRAELVRKLSIRPSWGEGFLNYLAGSGLDPRPTAALFVALRSAGVPVLPGARADLVDALINGGFIGEAWSYYTTIRIGADRRRSRDSRFTTNDDWPTPFDWVPLNSDGMTTSIQGGLVDVSAPAGIGGVMLRQMQVLPPGTYRLSGHSLGIEQDASALPYWTLICDRKGRELGRVGVPSSKVDHGRFSGTFTVPADCPLQTLALIARPSEVPSGLSGQFDHVGLVPVG